MRRVLVTGANGFVGAALLPRLAAGGWQVVALGRRPPGFDACTVVDGRLPRVPANLPDVDAIVHLASPAIDASDDLFADVIVGGTRALLDFARERAVHRFVFVSSVKALGEDSGPAAWNEESPVQPAPGYGRAKAEAETLVRTAPAGMGVVMRFPMVYGPGMTTPNMLRLFRLVERGVPMPFGAIENRRSILFVDHAVEAILLGLEHERAAGPAWMVADEPPLSTPDLIREIARALGRRPRLMPFPEGLWRAVGRLGDALPERLPAPRSAQVERLIGNLAVDSGRIRRELGFAPSVPRSEAMRRTADWYRSRAR